MVVKLLALRTGRFYRVFPGRKVRPGRGADLPTHLESKVLEKSTKLYLYSL